jgi:hypothetical protein
MPTVRRRIGALYDGVAGISQVPPHRQPEKRADIDKTAAGGRARARTVGDGPARSSARKAQYAFYRTAPPDAGPRAERLPAALGPEPSLVRDQDEVGREPEPPVAPEKAVRPKLETLPEEADAPT